MCDQIQIARLNYCDQPNLSQKIWVLVFDVIEIGNKVE
jgi:hypothetical protein